MLGPTIVLTMATAAACSPAAMKEAAKAAARPAHGRVGVVAQVVETQQAFAYHGGRHFPMQSVYKLPIAIAVLHRVEERKLELDRAVKVTEDDMIPAAGYSPLRDAHPRGGDFTIENLLHRAIVESDGSASDVLLRVLGGTRAVRRYMKQAAIHHIHVVDTEAKLVEDRMAQYDDYAEPEGMVELLARLQQGKLLNPENTARLLGWMREAPFGATRIRAKLPPGTVVSDKTGSSGTYDGVTPATNDVGLITLPDGNHMAIAIFLSDAKADATTRNRVIAQIAREAWECWAIPAEGQK